jgi:hypothetical protein
MLVNSRLHGLIAPHIIRLEPGLTRSPGNSKSEPTIILTSGIWMRRVLGSERVKLRRY